MSLFRFPATEVPVPVEPAGMVLLIGAATAAVAGRRELLEQEGYSVLVEHDLRRGLARATEYRPDLVCIEDGQLHASELASVMAAIRASSCTAQTPLIVFTRHAASDLVQAGAVLSPIDYVVDDGRRCGPSTEKNREHRLPALAAQVVA